jgi:hypothetical protein
MYRLYNNSGHDTNGYDSDDLFGDAPLSNSKLVYLKAAKVRVNANICDTILHI